jgi:hypothetical protein
MSTALKHFLAVLATDQEKLAGYLRNPDAVMQEAGLSNADRVVLRSGDPDALEARLDLRDSSGFPPSQGIFACLLRGIGSVLELIPPPPTLPRQTTADTLREDWRKIGGDLRRAINRVLVEEGRD